MIFFQMLIAAERGRLRTVETALSTIPAIMRAHGGDKSALDKLVKDAPSGPIAKIIQGIVPTSKTSETYVEDIQKSTTHFGRYCEIHNPIILTLREQFGDDVVIEKTTPDFAGTMAGVFVVSSKCHGKLALKILHPDLEQNFEDDIKLLESGSRLVSKSMRASVDNLRSIVEGEMDLEEEAVQLDIFFRMYQDHGSIKPPKLIKALSSPVCLAMEFVEGNPVSHHFGDSQDNRNHITALILEFFLSGVSLSKVHGDFNVGNILVRADLTIAPIDYGKTIQFAHYQKESLKQFLLEGTLCGCKVMLETFGYTEVNPKITACFFKILKTFVNGFWVNDKIFFNKDRGERCRLYDEAMLELTKLNGSFPDEFTIVMRVISQLESLLTDLNPEMNFHEMVRRFMR